MGYRCTWSRGRELNPRPTDYESVALPLSYPGAGKTVSYAATFDTFPDGSYPRPVRILFAAMLLLYAGVAVTQRWWPSAVFAPLLAWLLWRRHPRARFAAYVFFSVMTARALFVGWWPLALLAIAAIGALQLPAARRAWPRLTRGRPLR
jgi:hypothetical protein